ncbi:hypothetical protein [Caulobacter sp. 17J65-9]|uniref:hypothetical protein n=1 Tax=Caulobacter sp. 17J65-9 TaxID=2709382 RepID=UPI0013C94C30|nr:hypothetical protein [Caulobacter sp. 17J65-9]NEX92115.1 hypothetical protein [Caulobacter sp. 17J65-9]
MLLALAAAAGAVAWTRASPDARARAVFLVRSPASSLWARVRPPSAMTLCDLRGREAAMNGRVMRIRTVYFTDGIERSGLQDDRCLKPIVDLYDEAPKGAGLSSKVDTHGYYSAGPGGEFEVEFVGAFEHVPSSQPTGRFHMTSVIAARRAPPNPVDQQFAEAARAAFTIDLPKGAEMRADAESARFMKGVTFDISGPDYFLFISAGGRCGSGWFYGDGGQVADDGPGRRKLLVKDGQGRARAVEYKLETPGRGWPGCVEVTIPDADGLNWAMAERIAASVRINEAVPTDPHAAVKAALRAQGFKEPLDDGGDRLDLVGSWTGGGRAYQVFYYGHTDPARYGGPETGSLLILGDGAYLGRYPVDLRPERMVGATVYFPVQTSVGNRIVLTADGPPRTVRVDGRNVSLAR